MARANSSSDHYTKARKRWYQRNGTIIILFVLSFLTLLLVVPIGVCALILMWRFTRWPKAVKWMLTLIVPLPVYVLAIVLTTTTVDKLTAPPTLGTVALTAPSDVAIGSGGSIYVVDGRNIVHLSSSGKLLDSLGPTDSTIATDPLGNLYFARQGRLRVVSPSGVTLRQWQVGSVDLVAVDDQDHVYAASQLSTPEGSASVRRFTASGRLVQHWQTPYGGALAVDATGFVYAISQNGLARLDPTTGRVLQQWSNGAQSGVLSYDALAADAKGAIYVGDTRNGDTPFFIQKLTQAGGHGVFTTVNSAEESVGALAVDAQGYIYVVRDSYARPCPSNAGLDKLSPAGNVIGTFRSCSDQNS